MGILGFKKIFLDEKIKLKELSPKRRAEYIIDYYKWHILVIIMILVFTITTAFSYFTDKETVLSGYLLDSYYALGQNDPFYDFEEYAGINQAEEDTEFYPNLILYGGTDTTANQLFSTIFAGQTDFIISNPGTFLQFSYESYRYITDLREILTPEQLDKLLGRLFYVDASLLESLDTQNGTVYLPDHDKPETMAEPVPVGIDIKGCRGVDQLYPGEDYVFFAVVSNAPHEEMIITFLEYLFSEIV